MSWPTPPKNCVTTADRNITVAYPVHARLAYVRVHRIGNTCRAALPIKGASMPETPVTPGQQPSDKAGQAPRPPADRSLNTSVTEDERTEGGPVDEAGDGKLDTTNDT